MSSLAAAADVVVAAVIVCSFIFASRPAVVYMTAVAARHPLLLQIALVKFKAFAIYLLAVRRPCPPHHTPT